MLPLIASIMSLSIKKGKEFRKIKWWASLLAGESTVSRRLCRACKVKWCFTSPGCPQFFLDCGRKPDLWLEMFWFCILPPCGSWFLRVNLYWTVFALFYRFLAHQSLRLESVCECISPREFLCTCWTVRLHISCIKVNAGPMVLELLFAACKLCRGVVQAAGFFLDTCYICRGLAVLDTLGACFLSRLSRLRHTMDIFSLSSFHFNFGNIFYYRFECCTCSSDPSMLSTKMLVFVWSVSYPFRTTQCALAYC